MHSLTVRTHLFVTKLVGLNFRVSSIKHGILKPVLDLGLVGIDAASLLDLEFP